MREGSISMQISYVSRSLAPVPLRNLCVSPLLARLEMAKLTVVNACNHMAENVNCHVPAQTCLWLPATVPPPHGLSCHGPGTSTR